MMTAITATGPRTGTSRPLPPQTPNTATEGEEAARLRARLELALAIAARKSERRRPEDTSRQRRTMWELLRWTYGPQGVRPGAWSVERWTNTLFALDTPDGPACAYHIDAVAVHAAVCMLPPHQRDAVWAAAGNRGAMPPQPHPDARPVFRPVEREGRGRPGPITLRYWHGCAPLQLKPAERERLAALSTQAERETIVMERGVRWKYRYDPRKVTFKHRQRQQTLVDTATGRVLVTAAVEAEVEVPFCPIRWVVDIADLYGRYQAHADFHAGMLEVMFALYGHVLFGTELNGLGMSLLPPPTRWKYRKLTQAERHVIAAAWAMTGATVE